MDTDSDSDDDELIAEANRRMKNAETSGYIQQHELLEYLGVSGDDIENAPDVDISSVQVLISTDHVNFVFENGIIRVPFSQFPELLKATISDLLAVRIDDDEIHFDRLDIDIAIESLTEQEKYPLRWRDYPRILSVAAKPDFSLVVAFNDGSTKIYDCTRLFYSDVFRKLLDWELFRTVKIDTGGRGVRWSDDVDLSEFELWKNGFAPK